MVTELLHPIGRKEANTITRTRTRLKDNGYAKTRVADFHQGKFGYKHTCIPREKSLLQGDLLLV